MGLLVTTTIGLNRILGVRKKEQSSSLLGLMTLFEMSAIVGADSFALTAAPSSATIAVKCEYMSEALPTEVSGNSLEFETRNDPVDSSPVPRQWIVAMRLALVAFMATAWFLSRSYTTTMYLVLGLATAMIALQQGEIKTPDRDRWILFTATAEVLAIILIYGLVRLRH